MSTTPTIEMVIENRPRDLGGGFFVRRTLPAPFRRLVGPFIFFDHMGPVDVRPHEAVDVRPHPHIALATLTYLFDGEIIHRDSVGSVQAIRPGDVNWMVAGRGIVHSERASPEGRAHGGRMHGLQTWVALPVEHEETAPRFEHHPARTIPVVERPGARLRVLAGTAYGAKAPASVLSPTLYVHAELEAEATLRVDDTHEERAAYVVAGEIACEDRRVGAGTMLVFRAGASTELRAMSPSTVMLVGGASLGGSRHIWWNFVSSSKERIEQAKADWRERRFPEIPGDSEEWIPLPES